MLLAAWLALFQFLGNSILGYIHTPSLFSWMHEAYRSSRSSANDDAHGNFIPFLVVGLFWWKRKELLAPSLKIWWPGLLILAAAMVLHVLGYVIQQPRSFHRGAVHGNLRVDGAGLGTRMAAKKRFPLFPFCFFRSLGQRGASSSLFPCGYW